MNEKDICLICGGSIAKTAHNKLWLHGNNAAPVNDGQCCDPCNANIVIPRRIRDMVRHNKRKPTSTQPTQ